MPSSRTRHAKRTKKSGPKRVKTPRWRPRGGVMPENSEDSVLHPLDLSEAVCVPPPKKK